MPLLLRKQDNYYNNNMVSAPFYTKDEGYRMRVLAHPTANDDSESLRMVVCLCVLQGKYDQTLQWPLNARFTLTLYMNETNWKTEEVTFPSDKSSDHSFIIVIKDKSCVEYEIKRGYDITVTVFHLDIVRKFSWWEITLQIINYITDFVMDCLVNLWYLIVTFSSLLVLLCVFLCLYLCARLAIVVTNIRRRPRQYIERMFN